MQTIGARAARSWVSVCGLDIGSIRNWWVEIAIPCETHPDSTLEISVYPNEWAVTLRHANKYSCIRVTDEKFVSTRDELELVNHVTELDRLGHLMSWLEETHRLVFAKHRALVRSNVPNATVPVRTWLALLAP